MGLLTIGISIVTMTMTLVEAVRKDFTGATMRVDYYHTGTATQEHFSLDRIQIEGKWPGNWRNLLDSNGLGKYQFQIVIPETGRVLFSRGFCSIYGEWETTAIARNETWRTFPEAVLFPEPVQTVQLRLYKRDREQVFRDVWSILINPRSRFVERSTLNSKNVYEFIKHGPTSDKVDLLLLGDGYPEKNQFRRDARRFIKTLFQVEPFTSRHTDFNIRGLFTPAKEAGISRPRKGIFRDSPLATSYNALDLERYILTFNDRAWRDVAALAPNDFTFILVNGETYGGGGIYNLYATAAADSVYSPYLFVHEFAHHFAGLGDEYYTSHVTYEKFLSKETEPWEPNITALHDPARIKWADLVTEGTPLPTPWDKQAWEKMSWSTKEHQTPLHSEHISKDSVQQHSTEPADHYREVLAKEPYAGSVGAFEGASYTHSGMYRPALTCIMFSRSHASFCPVCRQAIVKTIDFHVK